MVPPSIRMAKRIIKDVKEDEDFPCDGIIRDFNKLTKEETMESLKKLIELETNNEIKKRLIEIYESGHWSYDKNLLILCIWNSYFRLVD